MVKKPGLAAIEQEWAQRDRLAAHWAEHGPRLLKAAQEIWRKVDLKPFGVEGLEAMKEFKKVINAAEQASGEKSMTEDRVAAVSELENFTSLKPKNPTFKWFAFLDEKGIHIELYDDRDNHARQTCSWAEFNLCRINPLPLVFERTERLLEAHIERMKQAANGGQQ